MNYIWETDLCQREILISDWQEFYLKCLEPLLLPLKHICTFLPGPFETGEAFYGSSWCDRCHDFEVNKDTLKI